MKQWIVREGAVRGAGKYLWTLSFVTPPRDWAGVGTLGGGIWRTEPTGHYVPEWDESQLGAERYDRIDKAARAAKRIGGRVVALLSKGATQEKP